MTLSSTRCDGSRGRVLVVDDEHLVAQALARVLRSAGFAVDVRTAVTPAVEALLGAKPPYEVALLDIRLERGAVRHGGDALEIVERVRQARVEIAVVMFSGQTAEILAEAALATGAFRAVGKSTDVGELLRALDDAVALVRKARTLPPVTPRRGSSANLFPVPARVLQRVDRLAEAFELTPMETRIVAVRMSGRRRAQAADELGMSEHTVQFHTANALRKTRRRNIADLVAFCDARGW